MPKTYTIFSRREIDLIAGALQHSDEEELQEIGDKLQSAIQGQAKEDMALVGTEDEE